MNYVTHDCRLEDVKYRYRNHIYDVSILSSLMSKTKNSINKFYDTYLLQPEEIPALSTKTSDKREEAAKLPTINSSKKIATSGDILNSISNYNTDFSELNTTTLENISLKEKNKYDFPYYIFIKIFKPLAFVLDLTFMFRPCSILSQAKFIIK